MFLSDARNITPINLWEHQYAGHTDDGTREVKDLFGQKVFDNPKPVQLIRRVLEHGTESDSLVLDFFSGSGTTGHAVMAQNAADGGQRRFLLVQLPEPLELDDKDQSIAAAFCDKIGKPRTISELAKERLRLAAKRIVADTPMFEGDRGFRVFKLDSTNIREWEPRRDDLEGSLQASIEHLKGDRTETDILYELLLKLGLDLCVPIEERTVAGDSAFADDVAKSNLTAILQQHGLENVRSL
jgi:adenine-specific DNA-methyltransferase